MAWLSIISILRNSFFFKLIIWPITKNYPYLYGHIFFTKVNTFLEVIIQWWFRYKYGTDSGLKYEINKAYALLPF